MRSRRPGLPIAPWQPCSSSSTPARSRCTRCPCWRNPIGRVPEGRLRRMRRPSLTTRAVACYRGTLAGCRDPIWRSAMRKVKRSDVLDYKTYNDGREAFRARILDEKAKRRVHVGEHLTFLFESTDTILYQVQEMMRLEQTVRESEIQHEIDTYNQLLGDAGELGCTLLIEIDDPK